MPVAAVARLWLVRQAAMALTPDPSAGEPQANSPDLQESIVVLIDAARDEGLTLRLIGGRAVRLLCGTDPARLRRAQDIDLVIAAAEGGPITRFLSRQGFLPDQVFNAINGHRQMFFLAPDGTTSVDIIVDDLHMCHTLPLVGRLHRLDYTVDVSDLLLSKLQIVELNDKDVRDIARILATHHVVPGDPVGTVGLGRFDEILSRDWGWWRTVTKNLEHLERLLASGQVGAADAFGPSVEVLDNVRALRRRAFEVPKTKLWKMRALVGEHKRWYALPEEASHAM